MTDIRIERETLIDASPERVWSLVAEPGFWYADDSSGTVARPGETVQVHNATHGDHPVRVEKADPPTYLAYRWVSAFPGAEVDETTGTLVEFTLTAEGERTRLRMVESGFARLALAAEQRDSLIKDHSEGWTWCVDALRTRAEQIPA